MWRDVTPDTGPTPVARRNATAVLDPQGNRLVLFGGRSSFGDLNDLWTLDLATHTWSAVEPAEGPLPIPRFTHNAVYDAARHRLLMWSGRKVDGGSQFFNDMWSFDLESLQWTELQPEGPRPEERYGTASAFDPGSRALISFAGFTNSGRFDDTWKFAADDVLWEKLSPQGNPGARCLHTAALDAVSSTMYIFGGQRGSDPLPDIWSLSLQSMVWTDLSPATGGPGGRRYPASDYARRNGGLLVFGGDAGTEKAGDTWLFEVATGSWQLLAPTGSGPDARDGAVAVYIEKENRLIVFGGTADGHQNDVWSLEGLRVIPTAVTDSEPILPSEALLAQNYPNPFNAQTTIEFTVPAGRTPVRLGIHDLLGWEVRTFSGAFELADGRVVWDGRDNDGAAVASGIYLHRLHIDGAARGTRKLLLLR